MLLQFPLVLQLTGPMAAWAMPLRYHLFRIPGNLLQTFISGEENLKDDRVWIWTHYGTAYRSLYTMYETLCLQAMLLWSTAEATHHHQAWIGVELNHAVFCQFFLLGACLRSTSSRNSNRMLFLQHGSFKHVIAPRLTEASKSPLQKVRVLPSTVICCVDSRTRCSFMQGVLMQASSSTAGSHKGRLEDAQCS